MSAGISRAAAVALTGLHGTPVVVEAAVSSQLPGMAIIGLPDAALAEAKLRVKSAIAQAGLSLSDRFLTINLSPASLPKQGSSFDLAIAIAALAASEQLTGDAPASVAHIGELALDGELRRPRGLLSAVIAARGAGMAHVMVPARFADEAALVPGINVLAVRDLRDAVAYYRGKKDVSVDASARRSKNRRDARDSERGPKATLVASRLDMAEVVGQADAVEAMVVAAAGKHHVSLSGPPGAGKTLLASRLPTILPPLSDDEALLASSIASLGGDTVHSLVRQPPFVNPHHTASTASMIGGGSGGVLRIGALTRACHGVLFLDEAPERKNTMWGSSVTRGSRNPRYRALFPRTKAVSCSGTL